MRKIFIALFALLVASTSVFAQTTEEILARMDKEVDRFDAEGFFMYMEIKLPIIGAAGTDVYILGDKYKFVTEVKDSKAIHWSDGTTDWEYDAAKNEVTISNAKKTEETQAESNKKMMQGVTDGYDVKLKKEDSEAWYFECRKSKSNTKKDDPKKMDLTVSKATYLPIELKSSLKGVTVTMARVRVGVTEEEVTFNPAAYPTAKIIDNR